MKESNNELISYIKKCEKIYGEERNVEGIDGELNTDIKTKLAVTKTDLGHTIRQNERLKSLQTFAIVTCLLLIITTTAMQTEIIGAPVRKFLIHVYEKFQEFIFPEENRGEVPETIEKIYQITHLPDGYELDNQNISDLHVQTIYKSNGKPLIFQQNTVKTKVALDVEHKNGIEIIDNIEYFTVESDGTNLIFWLLDGYQFTLYSVENLTEMFKIATTISYN